MSRKREHNAIYRYSAAEISAAKQMTDSGVPEKEIARRLQQCRESIGAALRRAYGDKRVGSDTTPTPRQLDVAKYIYDYIQTNKYAPTLREIGAHIGAMSTNAINDHLKGLERKGWIRRVANTSRSLVMLRNPHTDVGIDDSSSHGQ